MERNEGVLDKLVLVGDHTTRLSDIILCAVDDVVGGSARETDNNRFLYVDGGNTGGDSKCCGDGREETHVCWMRE